MNENSLTFGEVFDLVTKEQDGSDFCDAYLKLNKPLDLGYTITATKEEKAWLHEGEQMKAYEKKMDIFDGIESTFHFECRGNLRIADTQHKTHLAINGSGGLDYVECGSRGNIGDGWYDGERFLFRLSLPPNSVRDLIDKVLYYNKHFEDLDDDEVDESGKKYFMKLRIDFKTHEKEKDKAIDKNIFGYDVVRLYMDLA